MALQHDAAVNYDLQPLELMRVETTMLNITISRRHFMSASASVAGLAALGTGIGVGMSMRNNASADGQKRYMTAILDRYTVQSARVKLEYIDLFVSRFAEVYGVVDYQDMFAGPVGEYRLIKLFLKSVFRAA